MHRVYENGSYSDISRAGFSYSWNMLGTSIAPWGENSRSSCLVSAHNWTEMASATYRNVTDQDKVLSIMNGSLADSWVIADGLAIPKMNTIFTDGNTTPEQLLALLGLGWEIKDGQVVPHFKADVNFTKPVTPTLPTFYFERMGHIDPTLMTQTRQSSVVLTWTTDGGPIDYFQVLRADEGKENWEIIAPEVTEMIYEDTSVSPLLDYQYKVRAVVNCEGMHTEDTKATAGACKHTGKVEGYVRFLDGTGLPGISVSVTSGSISKTVVTDDAGHFEADELTYNGQNSIIYTVQPLNSGAKHADYEIDSYYVTFNAECNYQKVSDFRVTNGYVFSGYVMFDGTSIPVRGAQFLNNGHRVMAGTQPLESAFDGKFSFYVLPGQDTIQVTMEGHTFTLDGYYKSPQGAYFNDHVKQHYFYDNTRVKLIGRVVGGRVQGDLPLGNNLSRNNLGKDIKMVLQLEGDNTSWLVYDNLNPDLSKRDTTYIHKNNDAQQTYSTHVETDRKRIIVTPDSLTGEYELLLPPARWKVSQVYAQGYATLFQNGKVSEVIDLTDSLTLHRDAIAGAWLTQGGKGTASIHTPVEEYNAKYSCIYRVPVQLSYRQVGYDPFDYFGDRYYQFSNLGGERAQIPLAYEKDGTVQYTFGYPVFSIDRSYPIELSAVERYYWNNDLKSSVRDNVPVGGGSVTIHNGLLSSTHQESVTLNDKGQGTWLLKAQQTPILLTGDNALATISFTLVADSLTIEAPPLRAYTFNMYPLSGGTDLHTNSAPILLDILRDPPGSNSYATLSKGSKLNYSYHVDASIKGGIAISLSSGSNMANYYGAV